MRIQKTKSVRALEQKTSGHGSANKCPSLLAAHGKSTTQPGTISRFPKSPITARMAFDIWYAIDWETELRTKREIHAFTRGYATAWAHFTNPKAGERIFESLTKHFNNVKRSNRKQGTGRLNN